MRPREPAGHELLAAARGSAQTEPEILRRRIFERLDQVIGRIVELDCLVAHFGRYLCGQCERGEHARCAGHNNLEACGCAELQHDWKAAFADSYAAGYRRLEAMRK